MTGSTFEADIEFNVSHTLGMAVYAITRGRPVGIDDRQAKLVLGQAQILEHDGEYFHS